MQLISLQSSHFDLPEKTREAIQLAAQSFAQDPDVALQEYPDTWGDEILRQRIDAMTPTWDGDVLVTGSATQGLNLALNLIEKGKTLAVNTPVYFGVLRKAKELGLDVKAWESVSDLEAVGGFDALLLSSNFTPPHGQSFSKEDKDRLANLAEKNNAWVIEDNAYDPIWKDEFPQPITYNPDKIIRVCSLSKIAAPGFRIGFIKASPTVLKSLRSAKITLDLSTSIIPQILARDALQEDVLAAFRSEIQNRVTLLRDTLQSGIKSPIPQPMGGPFVCMPLPDHIDPEIFQQQMNVLNLKVDTNSHYYPDGENRPYVRLHAGAVSKEKLRVAAHRLTFGLNVNQKPASQHKDTPFNGKTVLIAGGQTTENIDNVRHFMNIARPEGQGHQLAKALTDLGAHVILVTAKTNIIPPDGVHVITRTPDGEIIKSTSDVLTTMNAIAQMTAWDIMVSTVSVPSLLPAQASENKLKVKTNPDDAVTMQVVQNDSPVHVLAETVKNASQTVIGFDQYQKFTTLKEGEFGLLLSGLMSNLNNKPAPVAQKEYLLLPDRESQLLAHKKIIVTSGRTHETISQTGDIITNFSSGRQGHAIAAAFAQMGAEVKLITGPTNIATINHPHVDTIHITTAEELQQACLHELFADAAVCVCAVGDFKAADINKDLFYEQRRGELIMQQNPDTLQSLGQHPKDRPHVVIGFAAETHDVINYGIAKLYKKGADAICANQVGKVLTNKSSHMNDVHFITRNGIESWETSSKSDIGFKIGQAIHNKLENT